MLLKLLVIQLCLEPSLGPWQPCNRCLQAFHQLSSLSKENKGSLALLCESYWTWSKENGCKSCKELRKYEKWELTLSTKDTITDRQNCATCQWWSMVITPVIFFQGWCFDADINNSCVENSETTAIKSCSMYISYNHTIVTVWYETNNLIKR